ncbi:MAG: hypothetical protein IJX39_08800 [Clostridia bacterium]|nr:hypothetical protein [Clostridia bacterium]
MTTCENREHLHVVKGRIVYAKCRRTGTEFLVCSGGALDPKTHYCACATWKGEKP